jgi:hypothetical protein
MKDRNKPETRLKSLSPASAGREVRRRVIGALERRLRRDRVLSPPLRWAAACCGLLMALALATDSAAGRWERARLADMGIQRRAVVSCATDFVRELAGDLFDMPAEQRTAAWLGRRFRPRNPQPRINPLRAKIEFVEEIDALEL